MIGKMLSRELPMLDGDVISSQNLVVEARS